MQYCKRNTLQIYEHLIVCHPPFYLYQNTFYLLADFIIQQTIFHGFHEIVSFQKTLG